MNSKHADMKTMTITSIFLTSCALLACNSGVNKDYQMAMSKLSGNNGSSVVFHRSTEPNEKAFTFLLPQGWIISGGITRVDPNTSGGSGNAIEAKLYMKLSSPDNKASIGWLPDTRFFDMRRYPGQNLAAPMFPDGSNYNGMMVMRLMAPADFIKEIAVPFAHPHAHNLLIIDVQQLQKLSDEYRKMSALMTGGYHFEYQTVIATMEYSENGIRYLEKMVCAIEDWGQAGSGLWSNKETWYVRAEKPVFEANVPLFATIGNSVKLNPEWLSREIRSQQMNSNIALQTQRDINRIDNEIAEHRSRTNSEINEQMYLTLTAQQDYINPFTGAAERGTNEWSYRWENEQGDVIYTDNQNYYPNDDAELSIKGFKRSESRK